MANMNMKMHGVVSITVKPVQMFDGLFKPTHCRTLIVKNADGTTFELDLFGDTPEAVAMTETA